MNHYVKPSVV